MNDTTTDTLSIAVEREMPHPPEKVWRALTQPHLIEAWLMKNTFKPAVNHRFSLDADWGSVHCEVRRCEPTRILSYSWDSKDLRSTVTWTLTPTAGGTLLRMEQEGFRAHQQPYYRGAQAAWPRFLAGLENVLAGLD